MGNSEGVPEEAAFFKEFNIVSYLPKPRLWQWKNRGWGRYVGSFLEIISIAVHWLEVEEEEGGGAVRRGK